MQVRDETARDHDAVRAVNESAFETPSEARLVDALREQAKPIISLVAEDRGEVVGHIMFSPASLPNFRALKLMALAPMAVRPGHQRKGIGSALVRAGLDQCRRMDVTAVVVLGHPDYYPRFDFVPASRFGMQSAYDVPDEVFMAMALRPADMPGKAGGIEYHPAFRNLQAN